MCPRHRALQHGAQGRVPRTPAVGKAPEGAASLPALQDSRHNRSAGPGETAAQPLTKRKGETSSELTQL